MSEYNSRLITLRESVFQKSHDPSLAWKTHGLYANLPGIAGYWSMASVSYALLASGQVGVICGEQSGKGHNSHDLAYYPVGTENIFGYDGLIPYSVVTGASAHWRVGNILTYAITGLEPHIESDYRGLTIGAWWQFSQTELAEGLMGKADLTYSYYMEKTVDNESRLVITDGASAYGITSSADDIDDNQWNLIIGRWQPGEYLSMFLNGVRTRSTTAIPNVISNVTADFYVGNSTPTASGASAKRVSRAFVCAMALSDTLIQSIWHHTRAMYGR